MSIQGNEYRVLLEATADISWQAGHFIGRGGLGSFQALDAASALGRKEPTHGYLAEEQSGRNMLHTVQTVCGSINERALALQ